MSSRNKVRTRLRTLLVCMVLEFGSIIGIPMRPDEIARLMQTMNAPRLAHVLPDESADGDDDEVII